MVKNIKLLIIPLLLLASFMFFPSLSKSTDSVSAATQEQIYVITLKEGTPSESLTSLTSLKGLDIIKELDKLDILIVKSSNEALIEELKQNEFVEDISLDAQIDIPKTIETPITQSTQSSLVSDPIYLSSQWHIRRVKADLAWDSGYTASHNTVVGIVDTGIATNHPDLADNIVYEKCFTSYQPTCEPYPQIPTSMQGNHGTVVAGIVGSLINDIGIVGVSPDVGLANYNVSEFGPDGIPTVYDSSIWAAMEDAGEQGVDILNFSFSYPIALPLSPEDKIRVKNWNRALKQAKHDNVMIIAAAGNNGFNLDDPSLLVIPCELNNVTCVGATNIRPQPVYPQVGSYDEATFYTSYGNNIDIAAPGGDCGGPDLNTCLTAPDPRYFTWTTNVAIDPTCALTESCPTTYYPTIGTSISTPHVVGVAALVIDIYKTETGETLKPKQVERILRKSAEELPTIPQLGAGMVDADAAVQRVLDMVD